MPPCHRRFPFPFPLVREGKARKWVASFSSHFPEGREKERKACFFAYGTGN